jgi:hypothetical protein
VRASTCMFFCCLFFCLPATKAQGECTGLGSGNDYKIAMDDVTLPAAPRASTPTAAPHQPTPPVAPSTPTPPTVDVERLISELRTQVEAITVEEGGAIVLVPCPGRRPHGESDFDRRLVEALNNNNVVLEIWGSFGNSGPSDASEPVALMQFVLIPVRYYEHFVKSPPGLAGVYFVQFSPRGSGPALVLFERSNELSASLALSMALKHIKEGKTASAVQYLCKAEFFLKQPDSRISQAKRDVLFQYINDLKASGMAPGARNAASLLSPEAKSSICSAPSR